MGIEIHAPENKEPIRELFALVSRDPAGNEGVVALFLDNRAVPGLFADKGNFGSFCTAMKGMVGGKPTEDTGKRLYKLRFTVREELGEL